MKIAFTTLGCPKWDLPTICARAKEYGYDGIDFRGLQETLDVTTLPAFNARRSETKRLIADAGLEVSGLSSSISICNAQKRDEIIEEAKRSIDVALSLDCPNIRVFGGGDLKKDSREEAAKVGRECLREILMLDGARFLTWCVETHDNWIASKNLSYLLEGEDDPAVGILWDINHTPRFEKEPPEETYAIIGKRVRYTHVKDAIYDPKHPQAMSDGWRYVTPGEGDVPLEKAIKLLKAGGYDGYLTFEHEKRWIPDLDEPEMIFPKYVAWVRRVTA